MATDGGGWTLIQNILHKGGTNRTFPFLEGFPLLGSEQLGIDELGSPYRGMAIREIASLIPYDEIRFYAHTAVHTHHFKTNAVDAVNFTKTNIGSYSSCKNNNTKLPGHNTGCPENITHWGYYGIDSYGYLLFGKYYGMYEFQIYPGYFRVHCHPDCNVDGHYQFWVR